MIKAKHDLEEFGRFSNDHDNRLPKSRSRCFDIGSRGGCGPRCSVFIDGYCEEPQEMDIEYLKQEYDEDELK